MVRRVTHVLRNGEVIEREEYHDGRYGGPGKKRKPKENPTPEKLARYNRQKREDRCRRQLIQYFRAGDLFVTLTYRKEERPMDMEGAMKDFKACMQRISRVYKKRGAELRWIRNIERGSRGAWHVHLVIKEIGDTASIIQDAWAKGGIYTERIRLCRYYDHDFGKLAAYMTKNELTEKRISEAKYGASRNMPLPTPKIRYLKHWKKEVKLKKGYEIYKSYEGVNEMTGYDYRKVTMLKNGLITERRTT